MRPSMRKITLREIKRTLGRWLTILAILALGVGFFVGLKLTRPVMVRTVSDYLKNQSFFDEQLISTLGFTEEDVSAAKRLPDVRTADGYVSADVLYREGEDDLAVKFLSITDGVNESYLLAGRMPEAPNECVADSRLMSEEQIGCTIEIAPENEEDTLSLLRYDTYTVVGIIDNPLYLNFERGTTSIGSGKIAGYLFLPEEGFDSDFYSGIYLKYDFDYEIYSDAYEQMLEEHKGALQDFLDERAQMRLDTIRSHSQEEIDSAQKELEEAESQIRAGERELSDSAYELSDAKRTLQENKQALLDGEEKLAEIWEEISENEEALSAAKRQIADGWAQLKEEEQSGREELDAAKRQIEEGMAELAEEKEALADGRQQLREAQEALAEGKEALSEGQRELFEAEEELAAAKEVYEQSFFAWQMTEEELLAQKEAAAAVSEALAEQIDSAIAEGWAQLSAAEEELSAAEEEILAGREEIEKREEEISAGEAALEEQDALLSAGEEALDAAEEELLRAQSAYEEGLLAFLQQTNEAREKLSAAERETDEGLALLADGRGEAMRAKQEIADGWTKISDGEAAIEEAEHKISETEAEIAASYEELSDGWDELSEAREELDALSVSAYLFGRDVNVGYVCFESDSLIVDNIANIFPVFFFLVAVLICMTTMSRMVEEGRTQIGLLKALGYGKGTVAGEYIAYAGSAAVLGGLVGFAVGSTLFPAVIWRAYQIMYNVPGTRLFFSVPWLIFCVLVSLACAVGATMFSCYVEFASVPAELMRPRSPQSGRRVFLERITFLWKRLSFLQKVSVRNVLRYKKRFVMMVLGVCGCTALLVAGYGLQDSCLHITDSQYAKIQRYDMEVTLSEGMDESDRAAFAGQMPDGVGDWLFLCEESVDVSSPSLTKELTLVVAEEGEKMQDFWRLYDKDGNDLSYPAYGEAVIVEKMAKKLNVSVGDTIIVRNADMQESELVVSGITTNFVYNYLYISEDTYTDAFAAQPAYKQIVLYDAEGADVYETSARLLDEEEVLSVTVMADVAERISGMMDSLKAVVVLIIFCAAALAFIVMYNLTNINIIERVREIATIKVLGFYAGETAQYVFRENVILTVIGTLCGLVLGKGLHAFIMAMIDVDIVSFDLIILPKSYLLSILLTFLFALVVDAAMYFKLKNIDMAESMKAVE